MAVSELSVSGIKMSMPTFEPVVTGPVLWMGGEFGPEGGLLATIAIVFGTVWMWRLGRRDESLSEVVRPVSDATISMVSEPREVKGQDLQSTNE